MVCVCVRLWPDKARRGAVRAGSELGAMGCLGWACRGWVACPEGGGMCLLLRGRGAWERKASRSGEDGRWVGR